MLLAFIFSTPIFSQSYETRTKEIEADVSFYGLTSIAEKTDFAIEQIITRSVAALRDQDFDDDADKIEKEFVPFKNYLSRSFGSRDIGDHDPLILWLAVVYEGIELKLGVEVCKALHISDIKTLNFCIPIVFKPCTFPMGLVAISRQEEYKNHFAKGLVYYGLIPVITYWAIDIGCLAATSGAGSFLCGLGATLGERLMGNRLAPRLSDLVFTRACS